MKWTCKGDVCGECGVIHKSFEAAQKHCAKDNRAAKRSCGRNAYSDRNPEPMDDEAKDEQKAMKEDRDLRLNNR